MPYVTCDHCALTTYSAARWAETEWCPHCGRELPRSAGRVTPLAAPPALGPEPDPPGSAA